MLRSSRAGSVVSPWHGRTWSGSSSCRRDERGARLRDPLRRVDVWKGVLRCVCGEDDPQLGNPDREVILGVAGRVDEDERQVAAVDRQALVAHRDVRRREDEVVEAARLLASPSSPATRSVGTAVSRSAQSTWPMMGAG